MWSLFSIPLPRELLQVTALAISITALNLPCCLRAQSIKVAPERGFFFARTNLVLTCTISDATMVVTTDGTEPSLNNGMQWKVSTAEKDVLSIPLTNTTTLRAAAFKAGLASGRPMTHTYIFPAQVSSQKRPPSAVPKWIEDPPGNGRSYSANFEVDPIVVSAGSDIYSFTNALVAMPSVSIATPSDGLFGPANGIYTHAVMKGSNWERRASIELIYPDGRKGFQVEAGLRMHGAVSRLSHDTPKHPFRIIFREKYGDAKLDFPLFPDSSVHRFDHLLLRTSSVDSWAMQNSVDFLWRNQDATYQRDQWMRDTQLAMGHPSPHGFFVHVFLNGLYWGVYNLTERPNESFAAAYLKAKKSNIDLIGEYNGELRAGNRLAWDQLLALADLAPKDPAILWRIQGLNRNGIRNPDYPVLINLDNFIDYMALHIYAPAIDWPNRNWWAARDRGPNSKGFHFFVWDQEIAIDRLDRTITWATNKRFAEVDARGTPAQIYDKLRRDPEFQKRFRERLTKHLSTGGALSVPAAQKRWAALSAQLDHGIVAESARWGGAWHKPAYTRADWVRMSNYTQNVYFPSNYLRAIERFRSVGLAPEAAAR